MIPSRLFAPLAPLCLTLLLACGGSVASGESGDGGSNGSGGSGDGESCSDSSPCSDGAACLYAEDACSADAKGTCGGFSACDDGPDPGPVCLCSGEVSTDCNAPRTASAEHCSHGTFACGDKACKQNLEACVVTQGGVAGGSPSYQCKTPEQFPDSSSCHQIPACGCLNGRGGLTGSCAAGADGQVTVTIDVP